MIMRLTARLGKKIHMEPGIILPADPNPFADWSARVFTVNRAQYILITNTVSLFSVVLHGKGITDDHTFIRDGFAMLREVLQEYKMAPFYERFIAPSADIIRYSKALNRSITASMNDLERNATFSMGCRGLSPFDASMQLNRTPMGTLHFDYPVEALCELRSKVAGLDAGGDPVAIPVETVGQKGSTPVAAGDPKRVDLQRVPRKAPAASTPFAVPLSFTKVYQFKVTLQETEPLVWRRIQVPGCYTFWDLHCAITDAFGWLDYHLHLFTLPNPSTDALTRFGIPDEEDDDFMSYKTLPGWKTRISRFFTLVNNRAEYVYDFGDNWIHSVELEAVLQKEPDCVYPRCVGGENACPPEDCGGPGGYENFKRSLQDHQAEDHDSLLEWVGGQFDPQACDLGVVRFEDPRVRWNIAFCNASVPDSMRVVQYHRRGRMPHTG